MAAAGGRRGSEESLSSAGATAAAQVASAQFDRTTYSSKTQAELQRLGGARLTLAALHERASLSSGARVLLGEIAARRRG
jgi:hypothetical protein